LALVGLAGGVGAACGDPPLVVVAREFSPLDAGAASPRDAASDTATSGDAVAEAGPSGRGRPIVAGGTVLTDTGKLLRGITINIDTNPTFPVPQGLFDEAEADGLNSVLVYLENWADVTGKNVAQADAIVAATEKAQLYMILALGGGLPGNGHAGNGWFDIDKIRSFWAYYAPRYKDKAHVLYEIQNQPEANCSAPFQDATISMEREAFGLIRMLAPDTHVLLFSYRGMPDSKTLLDALDRVSGGVNWSNASVAFDADESCVTLAGYPAVLATAASRHVPTLFPVMPVDGWEPYVREFEKDKVSWQSTLWLQRLHDLSAFRNDMTQAQITWCPDYGTFPQASATCGAKP
jgi:hypothetical protein